MGKNREERSKRKRGEFGKEFKLEAVRLATTGERSLAQVARDLGIHANLLSSWKREALASSSLAHPDVLRQLMHTLTEGASTHAPVTGNCLPRTESNAA